MMNNRPTDQSYYPGEEKDSFSSQDQSERRDSGVEAPSLPENIIRELSDAADEVSNFDSTPESLTKAHRFLEVVAEIFGDYTNEEFVSLADASFLLAEQIDESLVDLNSIDDDSYRYYEIQLKRILNLLNDVLIAQSHFPTRQLIDQSPISNQEKEFGVYIEPVSYSDLDIEGEVFELQKRNLLEGNRKMITGLNESVLILTARNPYDQSLAGYIFGRVHPDFENTLDVSFLVDPRYQRKGIGAQLMEGMVEQAQNAGYTALRTTVDPESESDNFMKKFGYHQDIRRQGHYSDKNYYVLELE